MQSSSDAEAAAANDPAAEPRVLANRLAALLRALLVDPRADDTPRSSATSCRSPRSGRCRCSPRRRSRSRRAREAFVDSLAGAIEISAFVAAADAALALVLISAKSRDVQEPAVIETQPATPEIAAGVRE